MRTPSPRVLSNAVDVYRFDPGATDEDGGVDFDAAYAGTPDAASVPCSVQFDPPRRDGEAQDRVSQANTGVAYFAADPGLKVHDRLDWVDAAGDTRTLFVSGRYDLAGRGGAFGVPFEERL